MIRVTELQKTCGSCPAQWEGRTDDDRPVYARYRWGYLYVNVGEPGDHSGVSGHTVFAKDSGHEYDGSMDLAELRALTAGVVEWPELDYDPDTLD